tara:strand:+ start:4012 stop:4335 length:324 start_codon:yes stop_codon:yes gene_type:complete
MSPKKLDPDSKYAQFDTDGDGIVSDEELQKAEAMIRIDNEDRKQDSQRRMAWLACWSMVGFAILPILPFIPESRLETLASFSDVLFISQAGIVSMFFGAQAYMAKKA